MLSALKFHGQRVIVTGAGSGIGEACAEALVKHLVTVPRQPAATAQDGFEATVSVLKASEAVAKKTRIVFAKEWFQV